MSDAAATSIPPATAPGATGFGHGKVILVGEHSVVFGQPALAASLSVGVTATATVGSGHVRVPAWNLHARSGDGSQVGMAVQHLLSSLQTPNLDFVLEAQIPARAGLGSSAAMAVAIARAAQSAAGHTDPTGEKMRAAVALSESVFHHSPSGIDSAAASQGGVGTFRKEHGWQPVTLQRPLKVLIGLSGKTHDTATQVASVARLCARTPVANGLIVSLGEVARAATDALITGDIDSLGRLLDIAHGLLSGLRVSSPDLDAMVHGARAAGAIGAKLTGAGGGGAVVALAPSHSADVLARWRADGFEGFESLLGGSATRGKRG